VKPIDSGNYIETTNQNANRLSSLNYSFESDCHKNFHIYKPIILMPAWTKL